MKASDIAKEQIIAELSRVYPNSKVIDKKLYINFNIEGEETQIAVSLTAPKSRVDFYTEIDNSPNLPETDFKQQEKEVEEIFNFFKI